MRILIADDDEKTRRLLEAALPDWGYQVTSVADGTSALAALEADDYPPLALLDWLMPGMNGLDVCRAVRARKDRRGVYLLLLTARNSPEDLLEGLEAGADEYIAKPFGLQELQARVRVAARLIALQRELELRVSELETTLARADRLEGLLPICSHCHSVRDGDNYWKQVERYLEDLACVRVSHSICPDCYDREIVPQLDDLRARRAAARNRNDDSGA